MKRLGTSLVEMLTVLSIVVLMAGMAYLPTKNYLNKENLTEATRSLKNDLAHIQYLAKMEGKQYVVKFMAGTDVYTVNRKEKHLGEYFFFGRNNQPVLVFYPNGRCEDKKIEILSLDNRKKSVMIRGMTGRIIIEK